MDNFADKQCECHVLWSDATSHSLLHLVLFVCKFGKLDLKVSSFLFILDQVSILCLLTLFLGLIVLSQIFRNPLCHIKEVPMTYDLSHIE